MKGTATCSKRNEVAEISRKRPDLKILSILSVLVFGGDRFAAAFNRRAQSVPRKAGAFDAGGELAHAGEDFQSAQVVLFGFGVEVAFDHPVEFVEHHFGLFLSLAFDGRGHHRGRGFRYRAARSLEAYVLD